LDTIHTALNTLEGRNPYAQHWAHCDRIRCHLTRGELQQASTHLEQLHPPDAPELEWAAALTLSRAHLALRSGRHPQALALLAECPSTLQGTLLGLELAALTAQAHAQAGALEEAQSALERAKNHLASLALPPHARLAHLVHQAQLALHPETRGKA
ncbi:MAG: hypothetical protein AAFX99_22210, partial [Myxococcota bacterium]